MPNVPSFRTMQECEDMLAVWWEERAARFHQAADLAASPMSRGKTLNDLTDMLGDHGEHLGWVNEWMPDAEDMLQQAKALATADVLAANDRISPTILKVMTEGRIHNFETMARSLDRLSATITHRMEALRTLVSTERERWKMEMGQPREVRT